MIRQLTNKIRVNVVSKKARKLEKMHHLAEKECIVAGKPNDFLILQFRMCKQHFISSIMKEIRREIRNLYRGADKAYAALDFTGVGQITEKDFLESIICKRLNGSYT